MRPELRTPVGTVASLLWRVSLAEFGARPLRAALFAGSIALGVAMTTAMYTAVDSAVAGFQADMEEVAGTADLQITFGGGETGFAEELISVVRRQPGIEHAAAVVRGSLGLADGSGRQLELFGVDVLQDDILDMYRVSVLERTADDFTIIDDPFGLFVTEKFARERGLAVGRTVQLTSVLGINDYTVHGILAFGGLADAYNGDVAVMYLPAAQAVAGKVFGLLESNIDQIDVALASGSDEELAKAGLLEALPPGMVVERPLQRRLANERVLGGLRATLIGISVFVLLAAMFVVYSTTSTFVVQRTPALASLLMMGATPRSLVALIMAEAVLLGSLGAVAGALGGIALAGLLVEDVAYGMSLNYGLVAGGSTADIAVSAWTLAVAALLGLGAALVSTWVPARRLGRLDPIAVVRGGQAAWSSAGASRGPKTPLAAVVVAAGAGAVGAGSYLGSALLCSAGGISVVAGLTLALLPVVKRLFGGPLKRLLGLFGSPGWIAGEQLEHDADRSLGTVAVITLCIAAVVTAASLPKSFRSSVSHWYGFAGDAIVSSRSVRGGWLSAPLSGELAGRLEQLETVAAVDTLRVLPGQRYRGQRVAMVGLSAGFIERALASATQLDAGGPAEIGARIESGRGLALATNLARRSRIRVGDRLSIDSPTGPLSLPVLAIVPDFVSDSGSMVMGAGILGQHWRDDMVNYFAVRLVPGASLAELRGGIAGAFDGSEALSVISSGAMRRRIDGHIKRAFDDVTGVQLLTIFITLAAIIDLLVSSVVDRRRSSALLLVAGATARELVGAVLLEALAVATVASLLGTAVGCIYSWLWIVFTYPVLVGYVLDLQLAWSSMLACTLMAVLASVLAAWFAARTSLGDSPLEAINAG